MSLAYYDTSYLLKLQIKEVGGELKTDGRRYSIDLGFVFSGVTGENSATAFFLNLLPHKIGLQKGPCEGKQFLAEEGVEMATSKGSPRERPESELDQNCGFQF